MHKIIAALLVSTMMTGVASAKDTYFTVYGGANWNDVVSDSEVKEHTGAIIGAAIGTRVPAVPAVRFEVDFSYRTNDVDAYGYDLQHDTIAVMTNVVYDVPVEVSGLRPFVLGGVGFAKTDVTAEGVSVAGIESTGIAWQLGAGVNWKVNDSMTAGVSYRYFQGPELEVLGSELSDGSNDSVVASVSFTL